MNLILCGLPACGKSTLGQILAKRLEHPFIETDREIERLEYQKSGIFRNCREIALHMGENYFRELEKLVVNSLEKYQNVVIALGGGTLGLKENREMVKKIGHLIYLKTNSALIWERISKEPVLRSYLDPFKPKASFEKIMLERIRIYEENCDQVVDTDQLDETKLVDLIKGYL